MRPLRRCVRPLAFVAMDACTPGAGAWRSAPLRIYAPFGLAQARSGTCLGASAAKPVPALHSERSAWSTAQLAWTASGNRLPRQLPQRRVLWLLRHPTRGCCRMYPTSILMPPICLDASEAQGYRRFWRWHPDALAHWYTHLEGDAWYKHI